MTPQAIRDLIDASPALQALATAKEHGALALLLSTGRTSLNDPAVPLTRADPTTKFTSLGIAERFPTLGGLPGPLAAEMVLQKLEGFAVAAGGAVDPATKLLGNTIARQMKHLEGNGMALGSPAIAAMLAVVVAGGGMTQPEADALTGIARVADNVSVQQVIDALNGA